VDEFQPPQLSKGRSNILVSELPEAVYAGDAGTCRDIMAEMKKDDVQGLIYVFRYDSTLPIGYGKEKFLDRGFLGQCGAEIALNSSDEDSVMVLYRIK
jgi:hypothetical protein